MTKQYLDYEGLKKYDVLIKSYIADHSGSGSAEPYDDSAILESINGLNGDVSDLKFMDSTIVGDLNALKALVGDTSVADQINAAITSLVNGAPNSLDTLKEIAD